MKRPLLLLLPVVLLGLVGCSTVETRIQQNADFFASLDPEDQVKIENGQIDLGFTPDMVYLAYGRPDRKKVEVTAEGEKEVWIYLTSESNYHGDAFYGWRPYRYYCPVRDRWFVYHRPIYRPVYRSDVYERASVEFMDGQVVAMSETGRRAGSRGYSTLPPHAPLRGHYW
ncbi:MAG: hypothetical protein EA425_12640 [Puniceicoccaceae bacterium]|nr:MAG: hypothetical protein EA425_12640 [Puniceicoccaceae bacterium]